jgi:hypothetical protein
MTRIMTYIGLAACLAIGTFGAAADPFRHVREPVTGEVLLNRQEPPRQNDSDMLRSREHPSVMKPIIGLQTCHGHITSIFSQTTTINNAKVAFELQHSVCAPVRQVCSSTRSSPIPSFGTVPKQSHPKP